MEDEIGDVVLERLQEHEVDIPVCKWCNQPILFFKNDRGKWVVLNMNLDRHNCGGGLR